MKYPILHSAVTLVVVCALAGPSQGANRLQKEREKKVIKKDEQVVKTAPVNESPAAGATEEAAPTTPPVVTETRDGQPTPATTAVAVPTAGEQLKWQVLSSGGVQSSSANFKLGGTLGQTASGMSSSAGYKLNSGFWQDFGSFVTSCCIGTTGNVNKSVAETPDLSDLSLLIAFLTVTPKPTLPCLPEANVNGSVAPTPDLSDLSLLIAFLTVTPKPILPNCP